MGASAPQEPLGTAWDLFPTQPPKPCAKWIAQLRSQDLKGSVILPHPTPGDNRPGGLGSGVKLPCVFLRPQHSPTGNREREGWKLSWQEVICI